MYICNDCDHFFVEPGTRTEKEVYEYWGANITDYTDYDCCPNCGSYEYDKATVCGLCDESVFKKFDYCRYHLNIINAAMDEAVHRIDNSADIGKTRQDVIQAIAAWMREREETD